MGEDKNNNFAEFNCIIKTKKYTKEEDKKEVVVIVKEEVVKEKEEVVIVKEEVVKEKEEVVIVKEEVVIVKEEVVKEHLKILLTKFNNVLFLSGAGTSFSAGYPLMKDLLKYLGGLEGLEGLKKKINELLKDLEKNKGPVKDIIQAAKENTHEKDKDNLEDVKKIIQAAKENLEVLKQDIEESLKDLEKLDSLKDLDSLNKKREELLKDLEKNKEDVKKIIQAAKENLEVLKQDIEESLKDLEKLDSLKDLDSLNKKIEELLKDLEKNKEDVKQIIKGAKEKTPEKDKDNLEEILNKIDKENKIDKKDDREKVEEHIVKILNIFEEICKKNPSKYNPHEMLIKKINSFLPNKYRFKIFTTNYDTLFERACKKINYIVNDGFVFTDNSYNPLNFGYELIKNQHNDIIDYIPNLIHLYKLHGSLNWRKLEGDRVIKCSDENKNDKPVLIYPNKNKYEDSYNLPYLDMISEFNSALQQKDTLLIVCGYSFSDKHLNNIIERAFNSNNKIHLVIVDPYKFEDNKYYEKAKAYNNISMVKCGFEEFVELLENKSDYMDESKNFYNK